MFGVEHQSEILGVLIGITSVRRSGRSKTTCCIVAIELAKRWTSTSLAGSSFGHRTNACLL